MVTIFSSYASASVIKSVCVLGNHFFTFYLYFLCDLYNKYIGIDRWKEMYVFLWRRMHEWVVLIYAGTGVQCATRRFHGRGYCEDISDRTPARSLSAARTAAKRSPTGQTCERTSRHIPRPRTTSASDADASSRSSPTSTSTVARREAAPPYSYRQARTWPPDVALRTTIAVDQRLPAADLTTICRHDSGMDPRSSWGPWPLISSYSRSKMVKRAWNYKA